jgi:hypothetical protein
MEKSLSGENECRLAIQNTPRYSRNFKVHYWIYKTRKRALKSFPVPHIPRERFQYVHKNISARALKAFSK